MSNGTVSVEIVGDGGPVTVGWTDGMNVQQALEAAHDMNPGLTFGLQYFGSYGYLVLMINGTYETFVPSDGPTYYWELFVNGTPAQQGIDGTILNDGDAVVFEYVLFDPDAHAGTLLAVKHESRTRR
jgi:Domain of unknown function (DUF4430)